VNSITASGTNLFACTWGGVYLSTNNGSNWTQSGLTNKWVNSIVGIGGNLFAETKDSIYLSTNNGTNWTAVSNSLANPYLNCISVSGTDLLVGTNDGGIWRRPLSEMITGVEDKTNVLPKNFSLSQNYPNPFNPTTTIHYSVPKTSFVTIKVYDMLGKEIATLVNQEKSAGNYTVQFNGSNLSSGIYFYRMRSGNFVETKKLLLLK
jgi:hypothetical protein